MSPDATYNALHLNNAAWSAHLALLRRMLNGPVSGPDAVQGDEHANHEAWVALAQAGIIHDRTAAQRSTGDTMATYDFEGTCNLCVRIALLNGADTCQQCAEADAARYKLPPTRPSTKTAAELIAEVEALASPDALPWEKDTSD